MRFGANYTPRRGWFHHWLDFDPAEQREDFEVLAGLGLDHVRVFCLWPVFQPQRGLIRQRALDDLARLYDVAAESGLDVTVDVLQGHLSSFEFYPSWTVTHHQRNVFTDPEVVEAEAELVAAVAHRLRDHGNHLGVSLANEPNNMAAPMGRDAVTEAEVDAWISRLLTAAAETDSLGLCDEDGAPKPVGERLRDVAADLKRRPSQAAVRSTAVVLDVGEGAEPRRASAPGGALFDAWMSAAAEGTPPAIVTSDRLPDEGYLQQRGILYPIGPAT